MKNLKKTINIHLFRTAGNRVAGSPVLACVYSFNGAYV